MSRPRLFFAPGEWYHCYSRGIDKRTVYKSAPDYARFTELLYLANATNGRQRSDLHLYAHDEIFSIPREDTLVDIGAYALMSNHFHILLYEKEQGGISAFMQKLGTAYTMYFNIKNERSGGLFTKPFRARHVANDSYFQHIVDYIHMNPADLFEPKWKEKKVRDMPSLAVKLASYSYSSLPDFENPQRTRAERTILGTEVFDAYEPKNLRAMIEHACAFDEFVKASP